MSALFNEVVIHSNDFLDERFEFDGGAESAFLALIVLNGATGFDAEEMMFLMKKWRSFRVTICADGGANRLHDAFSSMKGAEIRSCKPDHIIGDLDSARSEVLEAYVRMGTEVTYVESQDNNDLEKSLDLLGELRGKGNFEGGRVKVVVFGAFGGRFDQEIANCNTLYTYKDKFESIVLLGGGNSVTLLRGGRHLEHRIRMIPGKEGPGCSLLPLGSPVESADSTGLKWNLTNHMLAVGGLVSSSNRAEVDENGKMAEVFVRASSHLLWSCDLKL